MGITILTSVLEALQAAGYDPKPAYPGQRYPVVTKPVITAHIDRVDSQTQTAAVDVTIHCPADMGGLSCEKMGVAVSEVLCDSGASCVQQGCVYDGIAQIYSVTVSAQYCWKDEVPVAPELEFTVYAGGIPMPMAVGFSAEQKSELRTEYVMGESAPAEVSVNTGLWEVTLEEWFPPGFAEGEQPSEPFTLRFITSSQNESYPGCCWTGQKREFSSEGLRVVRKGVAKSREENVNG